MKKKLSSAHAARLQAAGSGRGDCQEAAIADP
jgi:hypothetical protein